MDKSSLFGNFLLDFLLETLHVAKMCTSLLLAFNAPQGSAASMTYGVGAAAKVDLGAREIHRGRCGKRGVCFLLTTMGPQNLHFLRF